MGGKGTPGKRRKGKRKRPEDGALTRQEARDLLEAQEYQCALTGEGLTPQNATIDHIVPLSKGGAHHPSNAQVVTKAANQAKGELTMSEFLSLCRSVVEWSGGE